jgi:sulfite reductase (NADPH) hemoprotein beta-component
LKYTIDKLGVDAFKTELEKRCGFDLKETRPYVFTERKDHYGWKQDHTGKWHYTIFVENGRVLDDDNVSLKSGLLEIAKTGKTNFRFTGNQNIIVADIIEKDKPVIEKLLTDFDIAAHKGKRNKEECNGLCFVQHLSACIGGSTTVSPFLIR